jgi:hypothetical protein
MARFRFGPLGRLMVVDAPRGGADLPVEEIGAMHESLNGTHTKDVFGHKLSAKIDLEGLDPRALSWFEMAYRGALGSPLFFVDEERVNRLSAAVGSALSAWAELDPFSNLNGTRTTIVNPNPLLPDTAADGSSEVTPAPISAQQWVSTATGIVRCGPMIPVQPGEHVTFSIYCLSGTPTLEFTPYDAAGVAGSQTTSTATVIPGTVERRWKTYVTPSSGVAAIQPCIRHAGAQTSAWTALQLEEGDAPTAWVMGVGCPQVLVDSFPTERRFLGSYANGTVNLVEA